MRAYLACEGLCIKKINYFIDTFYLGVFIVHWDTSALSGSLLHDVNFAPESSEDNSRRAVGH